MSYLLSAAGEAALASMIQANPLLAFDFDGTLSPMVALPEQARMPAGIALAFRRLCDMTPVAVITGRSVEDIQPRLPAGPKYIVGNHGAEGVPGEERHASAYQAICMQWMEQIQGQLQWAHLDPGLMIEHKPCSICVHYGGVRDRASVARQIESELFRLDPLPQVIGGTHGINLLPSGAPTKRRALESLLRLEGRVSAFYIGDDETDEIVFRDAPPQWVTARVGRDSQSAARYFLPCQSEVAEGLQTLIRLIEGAQTGAHRGAGDGARVALEQWPVRPRRRPGP